MRAAQTSHGLTQQIYSAASANLEGRWSGTHAFASNLLLPKAGVGIALRKIREIHQIHQDAVGDIEILYLGRLFGVSFQVSARRCEDLGLLPSGGALSLYEQIKKEFVNPEKRAEQLGLPPRPEIKFPTLPRQVLEGAIKKVRTGEVSIGRASESSLWSAP